MEETILRKLFLGFIQVHILHHAQKEPVYGSWMLQELQEHGYRLSPGTLYPVLHSMETGELLDKTEKVIDGKVRKYYQITPKGRSVLEEAKKRATELYREICEDKEDDDTCSC